MGRAARLAVVAVAVSLAAVAVAPGSALAQHPGSERDVHFDVHATFPAWYTSSFGTGFRVDITFLPHGALRGVDDTMAISFGGDLLYFWDRAYEAFGFFPTVNFQWNFFVSSQWSFAGEGGLAVLIGPSGWNNAWYGPYVSPTLYGVARFHFTPDVALLFRVGFPAGFEFGITF